jgi:hypothetical protein
VQLQSLRLDTYNLLNYFANSSMHLGCEQFWKYLKSLCEIYAHFEPNLDPTSDKKNALYNAREVVEESGSGGWGCCKEESTLER